MNAWPRARAVQLCCFAAAIGCSSPRADESGAPLDSPSDVGPGSSASRDAKNGVRSYAASKRQRTPAATGHPADWSSWDFFFEAQPKVAKPQALGSLAGPRTPAEPRGVQLYGTDMGLPVDHAGELYILFGDTWANSESVCEETPPQDDTIGIIPRDFTGKPPVVRFLTEPEAPRQLRYTTVHRDGESLRMGYGRAPVAAFSDGQRSFAVIQRLEPASCDERGFDGTEACQVGDGFTCQEPLGTCEPPMFPLTILCDTTRTDSCLTDQTCVPKPLCVDRKSSQYQDGSHQGSAQSVAHRVELAAARSGDPSSYDSLLSLPTSKFKMPATRAVASFTGKRDGNDYSPGHDTLLFWGRAGFLAENGRESHLYLMQHKLPLPIDANGKLDWKPQYYAGVDPFTREPIWSALQSEAKPIALDGSFDGSPHETIQMVGMYNISWLGAPINKWVMLYGGDLADYLMLNPESSRESQVTGAVYLRFADHPWGPFSPPVPHLAPGSPFVAGDGYGPGGFLYHPLCADAPGAECAPSDPRRPPDIAFPGCQIQIPDPGRLYQPSIVDNYTKPNADGGIDMIWIVSTWNPYGMQMFKTSIYPPDHDLGDVDGEAAEPADRRSLERLSNWKALPELGFPRVYVQQSSSDRGRGPDAQIPLSSRGNRDFNNFICRGAEALLGRGQYGALHFDEPACEESYVRGAVLARFRGAGHLARMWLGAASLMEGPADDEVLRIYVDDDPVPKIDVPLAEALDGRAGEIFAPPFGAGSPYRMSWYYPVAFRQKLIVALDGLGSYDQYDYQCDAVLEPTALFEPLASERLPERDDAARQLSDKFHPAGLQAALIDPLPLTLEPNQRHTVNIDGPATIHEFRIRVSELDLWRLASVDVRITWDDDTEPAIEVPLLDLLGGAVPPEQTSHALTSYLEGYDRVLGLKLPMPFFGGAEITFHNRNTAKLSFELRVTGEATVPFTRFGKLHVQPRETRGPTQRVDHLVATAVGRGRLVGVCGELEGHADPNAGYQYNHLNFLEGDVHAFVDGVQALDGTGTEEYADDNLYFVTAPHANAFAQAWGVLNFSEPPARVSFCRWHVLGTELDFENSFELTFELGGMMNPSVVDRYRTVAYLYLED